MRSHHFIFLSLSLITSVGFAQEVTKKEKYAVKIFTEDNGKAINIDTTFATEAALKQFLKENNIEHMPEAPEPPPPPTFNGKMDRVPPPPPPAPPHEGMGSCDELRKEVEMLKREMRSLREDKDENRVTKSIRITTDGDEMEEGMKELEINLNDLKSVVDKLNNLTFSYTFDASDEDKELRTKKSVVIIKNEDNKKKVNKEEELKMSEGSGSDLKLTSFTLSPNPAKGVFKLSLSSASKKPLFIEVYDSNGLQVYNDKLVKFSGVYDGVIDISTRAIGNYVLKIKQENKVYTHKLIVE